MARGQFAYPDDLSAEELGILKAREQFFCTAFPGQSLRWVKGADSVGRPLYHLTPYTYPSELLFTTTLDELRDEQEFRLKQRIEGGR